MLLRCQTEDQQVGEIVVLEVSFCPIKPLFLTFYFSFFRIFYSLCYNDFYHALKAHVKSLRNMQYLALLEKLSLYFEVFQKRNG